MSAVDPVAAVSLLTTLAGSIFGKKGNKKPSAEELKQLAEIDKISGTGDTVQGIGDTENADYNAFRPQQNSAIKNLLAFLGRDPNTDQWDAARLAERTQGSTTAAAQAQANIDANAVQRGIVGSGSDVGSNASIEGMLAADRAQAGRDLYKEQLADKQQRLGLATDVLSTATNNARTAATGAYAQATGNAQVAAGGYGDYAARERARIAQEEAQRQAATNGAIQAIGTVAAKASVPTRSVPTIYEPGTAGVGTGSTTAFTVRKRPYIAPRVRY